ncbi:ATP-binding cassette transporter abc4 [Psilocybe cubensis]|uniref:ATP-binding cassette transporter abc4 n=1 Tax=Psilocybe cubensis TaxID=181762 RepID=A0ACB8H0K0_PSICU|nr:ATP-binding cassette transporter abc4 [Psilocybe cubensis]KAH9480784.1 ATP-binding cassette transporter abc4 [Psilocybe cubensis]
MDIFRGAKKRHIVFGLLRAFRKEYSVMAFCVVGQVVLGFFSPIGINRILTYLENGGEGAIVRPWFWILCLFIGPMFNSVLFQWYIFMATKALAHAEALITQLVFEHSLRIRLASESGSDRDAKQDNDNFSGAGTPDTASVSSTNASASVSTLKDASSLLPDAKAPSTETPSASLKGKGKAPEAQAPAPVKPQQQPPRKDVSNLIGKINNLVTTDLGNITDARDFLLLVLAAPLQILACTFFLYNLLGWSSFVGLAAMIMCLPIPGYAAKLLQDVQRHRMKMTDARVQDVTEVVSVLRMVKLFGWEGDMSKRIKEKRDQELSAIWKYKILSMITGLSNVLIPNITMIATYATYTLIMKQSLTPSIIFSSVTVFSMLRIQLQRIQWQIAENIQGKVSLDRVTDFLQKTELLDSFQANLSDGPLPLVDTRNEHDIGFRNASFSWRVESDDDIQRPSRRSYRLKIEGELLFKRDCINLIVGPTGSGKTSILMALLGEMHFIQSTDSWFNLPREDGVAYAAQESWVQNETIRDNILFGSPYDEDRYRKVIYQCALDRDIELFEAGDATEVGEKGITLRDNASGGQKARITLARAIYSKAKIILLDDVLAALDVHTAVWIVNKCFRGEQTHNVAVVAPIAGFIVSLGNDGTIQAQGSDTKAILDIDQTFAHEMQENEEEISMSMKEVPSMAKKEGVSGKLVLSEEVAKGHVTWKSIKLFISALGGDYPFVFYCLLMSLYLVSNWTRAFQTWFLGYWGSQYERHSPEEVKTFLFLGFYSLIIFGSMSLSFAAYIYYTYGTMRASRTINALLVESALSSTLRWLDETPTSRIIARCTQDIRALDGPLTTQLLEMINVAISMITNFGVIIIFTPVFLSPGIAVAALALYLGNMYLRAQLSVKREKSNARSPVLAHFGAAVAGLVSVRAYGVQEAFIAESLKRIDHYTRIARVSYNLNRWVGIRINFLGNLFSVAIASYLVYGIFLGSSNTGFTLSMAAEFCSMILYWVRVFNEFEVQSNSLERIQDYIDIDHEPSPTPQGKPPAAWPTSGEIVVENLSARYSQAGPTVLHNLSFRIGSGQRVGVVGRTGSGKSSLTLALLRCIVTEGTVYYDGIDTNKINLDALRSNITIIPQTPELISGTLRRNLDPLDLHDDATLNDSLRSAGLFSIQEGMEEHRITLDTNISAGGSNLSVGERQIIALARAIIRGSKLLILDEATSAIDYKTDAVIQTTLRRKLDPGVTVITVAHRLQTIMDADVIMVLDEGHIIEFDSPKALLHKEGSKFKGMVDESGDKTALYDMAEGRSSSGY